MPSARLFLLLMGSLFSTVGIAGQRSPYALTRTVALGTPDHWDLLSFDEASHRVYIAHGDRVTVVDGHSGKLIGSIEGFPGGTHGVAIVPGAMRGYTDDGRAGTAASFDTRTLRVLKTVRAEPDADAVVFDPTSGHVFVIDGDPGKITVIDPRADSVVATLDGGGKLEVGAADGAGKLYINGEQKREIVRVDTRSNTVDAHWPIPTCESPHGLAIDAQSRRVFATCENRLMVVIDADTGRQVASLPIGARSDGAAFDPHSHRAFSSNGDGTLTVVAETRSGGFVVAGTVPTALGARTMTLDPGTGRLFLMAADTTVNSAADPADARHRYSVVPGTARLLFLDPLPAPGLTPGAGP